MTKNLIKVLILIVIYGCSYEPILLSQKHNFQFNNITSEGESKINKLIKDDLVRKSNGLIKYDLKFETTKLREIVSSNEKGDPTSYKIKIDIVFRVTENNKNILESKISKQTVYNNINDKFELSQYEENIINNLAYKISEEILMSITAINK